MSKNEGYRSSVEDIDAIAKMVGLDLTKGLSLSLIEIRDVTKYLNQYDQEKMAGHVAGVSQLANCGFKDRADPRRDVHIAYLKAYKTICLDFIKIYDRLDEEAQAEERP